MNLTSSRAYLRIQCCIFEEDNKSMEFWELVTIGRKSLGRFMVLLFLACFHLHFAKNDTPCC